DDELRAAASSGALVVLDALEEIERARAEDVRSVLIRLTPGIEAETHHAIRTAHAESKFGLAPHDAVRAVGEAGAAGLDVAGLHLHIGSQLTRADESRPPPAPPAAPPPPAPPPPPPPSHPPPP